MGRKNTVRCLLKCSCCEQKSYIQRKESKRKQPGHVKHMWCFKCKKVTAHVDHNRDYEFIK